MGVQNEKEQPHLTEFGQCFLNKVGVGWECKLKSQCFLKKVSRSEGVGVC